MENLKLDRKMEIWGYYYKGIWYELHVDSTEEREIYDVFAEKGEITKELRDHFDEVVKNIDN